VSDALVRQELAGALATRTPGEVRDWLAFVQEMLREVLEAGVDYGYIPKVEKPILLKPGAEKLALLADLGTETERVAWEPGPTGEMGATYKTTATRAGGRRVQVERYAGYDENQFLSINPNGTLRYRAPWDTVIAMSQKRAYVAAVKAALGLSGLFADLERGEEPAGRKRSGRPSTGEIPAPAGTGQVRPSTADAVPDAAAPGSRRPVERPRRPDTVPVEVYDDLPEAQGGYR
jgi:hypothetical protein